MKSVTPRMVRLCKTVEFVGSVVKICFFICTSFNKSNKDVIVSQVIKKIN